MENSRIPGTVAWHNKSKRWRAIVVLSGQQYSLGYFDSEEEAEQARRDAWADYELDETLPPVRKRGQPLKDAGVYWDRNAQAWNTSLYLSGRRYSLGYFNDKEEAAEARANAQAAYERDGTLPPIRSRGKPRKA